MILIVLVLVLSLLSYYTSSLNLFGKPSPSSSQIQVPDLYVQYLPSKDKFNAIPTKSLIDFGKIVKGPIIPVQCRKGECRKCEVMIEGKVVLGCKVKIPSADKFPTNKVFQVTIPSEPGKKGVVRKSF